MDDSDQCIEEEGGEIRSRAQDRAEQLQVSTTEQGRIPFLGLQEWSGDPVCGWPLHAVASWVGAAASSGSGASTVIRALWTRD